MAPALVLSGNILASTVSLAALFPALAAALVASESDAAEPVPGDRARRLLLAAGVCVLAEVRLVSTGFEALADMALVGAVPAALAAWVLSALRALARVPALVRPLVALRAPRAAYLVAALSWPWPRWWRPRCADASPACPSHRPGRRRPACSPGGRSRVRSPRPGRRRLVRVRGAQAAPRLSPLATRLLVKWRSGSWGGVRPCARPACWTPSTSRGWPERRRPASPASGR